MKNSADKVSMLSAQITIQDKTSKPNYSSVFNMVFEKKILLFLLWEIAFQLLVKGDRAFLNLEDLGPGPPRLTLNRGLRPSLHEQCRELQIRDVTCSHGSSPQYTSSFCGDFRMLRERCRCCVA
jgi:hypothetical protein